MNASVADEIEFNQENASVTLDGSSNKHEGENCVAQTDIPHSKLNDAKNGEGDYRKQTQPKN